MSYPDLSIPLRTALVGVTALTAKMSAYKGSYPVFTRRPVPDDITYPIIVVSPDITKDDIDGISDFRPIITRDITVFGLNKTAPNYRDVESMAQSIHDLFHRNRHAITVSGWTVTAITARGPIPAPVDDDQTVARLVTLSVNLSQTN